MSGLSCLFPINSIQEIVTNILENFNASFIQIIKAEEIKIKKEFTFRY